MPPVKREEDKTTSCYSRLFNLICGVETLTKTVMITRGEFKRWLELTLPYCQLIVEYQVLTEVLMHIDYEYLIEMTSVLLLEGNERFVCSRAGE